MTLPLLRFVEEGWLLSFRGPVQPGEWELIVELPAAKARAWEQSDEFPCWTDLRESVVAASGRHRTAGLSESVGELSHTPDRGGDARGEDKRR